MKRRSGGLIHAKRAFGLCSLSFCHPTRAGGFEPSNFWAARRVVSVRWRSSGATAVN